MMEFRLEDEVKVNRCLVDGRKLAGKIIDEQWRTVEILASELAKQRGMQGEEVITIIDEHLDKTKRKCNIPSVNC